MNPNNNPRDGIQRSEPSGVFYRREYEKSELLCRLLQQQLVEAKAEIIRLNRHVSRLEEGILNFIAS